MKQHLIDMIAARRHKNGLGRQGELDADIFSFFFGVRPEQQDRKARLLCTAQAATTTMVLTLFTTPGIPNPDLVHAYMAEVGIGDDKVV